MSKKLFAFLSIVIFSLSSLAQTWQDTVSLIEKTLNFYQPQNPGCQLSISRNGKVIFSKAWGMADLERQVPLTTNSIIEAGSVSKQFTAAAILLLARQKRLSLRDDVRKYIPELPDYGSTITLSQMMHHTSGIRDWGAITELTGWPRTTKAYTNADALRILERQKGLNNKPGDEFLYSNSNYNLFAIIVERVSGLSLAEFTKKYIFIPAGMTHTQWRDDYKRIVPNRAIAYKKTLYYYETDMPNENAYGNGGLLTTAEDLLKWNDYYLSGKLGKPSLLSAQLAVEPLNNGVPNNYAAGLFIHDINGLEYIEHAGATAGYRALLESFPQLNLSIAFLSNTSEFDSKTSTIRSIKNIFVKTNAPPAPVGRDKIAVSEEKLKSLAGWYRNERTGEGINVRYSNQNLFTGNKILSPFKEDLFSNGEDILAFKASPALIYITPERDSTIFAKVAAANFSDSIATEYTGNFFSEETNSSLSVTMESGNLIMLLRPGIKYALMPTYVDGFEIKNLGSLYFERNAEQTITGLRINVPRARNVAFHKSE